MSDDDFPDWAGDAPISIFGSITRSTSYRLDPLFGARTFMATEDGFLAGMIVRKIWRPGPNVAECWAPTGWRIPGQGAVTRQAPQSITQSRRWKDEDGKEKYAVDVVGWKYVTDEGHEGITPERPMRVYDNALTPEHMKECNCGLHGYFSGSLDYADRGMAISGVVQAWGYTLHAGRGFRTTNARIVALYLPLKTWTYSESHITGSRPKDDDGLEVGIETAARRSTAWDSRVTPLLAEKIEARYGVTVYTDLDLMLRKHPTEPPKGAPRA